MGNDQDRCQGTETKNEKNNMAAELMYQEQSPAAKNNLNNSINQRWGQLYELQKEQGDTAIKYLFFTNSGGAIATLGFLGAFPESIKMVGAVIALIMYMVGVIMVGMIHARNYHKFTKLFDGWKHDVNTFYQNKISWRQLHDQDDARSGENYKDYVLPYAAFILFIAGSISGAMSLLG